MVNKRPLGPGRATTVELGTIEATFPLSGEMAGWCLTSAEVHDSGYFLTLRFEQIDDEEPR